MHSFDSLDHSSLEKPVCNSLTTATAAASCAAPSTLRDPFHSLNDPALLSALKADGAEGKRAFNRFMRLSQPLLRARVLKSFTDPDEAEDVLGETYAALATGLETFRGEARLTTWIYGVLQHKICDHIARLQRRRRLAEEVRGECSVSESIDEVNPPTHWDALPDRIQDHARLQVWIAECLVQLNPSDSEAWTLREVDGLSTDEAAEKLGISGEAFRVRLFRARQRLASLVKARMQGITVVEKALSRALVANHGYSKAA